MVSEHDRQLLEWALTLLGEGLPWSAIAARVGKAEDALRKQLRRAGERWKETEQLQELLRQGHSLTAIATLLGKSEAALRTQLHRARKGVTKAGPT
jgi:DNA-directed RNA polymerase specialized sigma24 family protein